MTDLKNLYRIIDGLDLTNGLVKNTSLGKVYKHPIKQNIAKQTFELIPEIDAIYFTGEHPLIYFKAIHSFDPTSIKQLHKKVWNQGRVPLMFISTPTELRIYNCYNKPLSDTDNVNTLELDKFSYAVDELERLKKNYHQAKIDSGIFWETQSGKKIHTAKKVDHLLVSNLKETKNKLYKLFPKKNKNSLPIIHNLLGRSLFILYLEDRKVITSDYYTEFLKNTNTYFDLLASKQASYSLYTELNKKFNGDLFTVTKEEIDLVTQEHLNLVRNCFYGDINVKTGQLLFFRIFDFSIIPIELISAIYEEFLHTEEGEEEISNQGAYYTPHSLVEFVLNEVLPYPDEKNKNYELKILDPACGSGIFLVEAYRRLIERWKYVNKGKRISVDDLRSILKNSIHGVEKNSEAIKVASFSLYLTVLNYLEPKSIWTKVKFPHLIKSDEKKPELQGNNLFHGDTFENKDYEDIQYDLIIGNPPWKRGNLAESLSTYISQHSLAKEAVLPFLHKMAHIAPTAKIALVSSAKILFNSTSGYVNFRDFLFNKTKVDCIVNFSALRKSKGEIGKKLFASATGPTIVIFYNGIKIKKRNDAIVYCVPKPQYRDSAITELIIDSSDIKFIPFNEAANPYSNIWKVAMWGTYRDYILINLIKEQKTLSTFLDEQNWVHGNGFQTSNPCDKPNNYIALMPHLASEQILRYYTPQSRAIKINQKKFRRLGCEAAYKGPHVLVKKGQSKREFCSSYIDYDCSFKDGVYGIYSAKATKESLKALTGYLNSKFITYYLFLTSASWGIEREQIFSTEVFDIPAAPLLMINENTKAISKLIDDIIKIETTFTLGADSKIIEISKGIDKIIFKDFKLKEDHLALIDNLVNYSLDFFQEGVNSKAICPVQKTELEKYVKKVCKNMNRILVGAKTSFWAKTYNVSLHNPLTIISIHFNKKNETGTIIQDTTSDVDSILKKLNNHIYEQHSESVYLRKVVKYYDGDVLFIAKPNEKRYWTEAIALEDSDNISYEMMTQGESINE